MTEIEVLDPAGYSRVPWKNGGGISVEIAREGGVGWADHGLAWTYGRTSIVAAGPFSDLSGFERLQVVIKGTGLVLVSPSGEIDLRTPFRPQRYDGGLPIVTRLENGAVEVANLIADRRRFRIDMHVIAPGAALSCRPGWHIVHAADAAATVEFSGETYSVLEDHAVRLHVQIPTLLSVAAGRVVVASILPAASLD